MRGDGLAGGAHGVCMHRAGGRRKKGRKMAWGSESQKLRPGHGGLIIYGRDSCINAVIGKYMSGQYICMPDIDTGCPLSRLSDLFWNKERLSANMNETDAVTVAHALRALSGYTGKDWL